MSGDSSGQRTNTVDTATRRSVEDRGRPLVTAMGNDKTGSMCFRNYLPHHFRLLVIRKSPWENNLKKVNIGKISLIDVKILKCFHLFPNYKIAHIQYWNSRWSYHVIILNCIIKWWKKYFGILIIKMSKIRKNISNNVFYPVGGSNALFFLTLKLHGFVIVGVNRI